MDFKTFQNPDSILRPAPFWAINDRITPEETARQMKDMLRVGLSGGFFHSRHGMITDYLSKEWFDAMRAALEVAKENDGYLWLYDEDLWPSGNAGGQVAGMKDDYRATTLQAEFVPEGQTPLQDEDGEVRAAYKLKQRNGTTIEGFEMAEAADVARDTSAERVIFRKVYQAKTPWWGGESYANLLHPEAMHEFVRLTHERYKEELGDEFGGPEDGKRIPGIFTDEPQLAQGPNALPWWDGIPEKYSEWHGRDFWQDLPYLFFDGPDARKIRLLAHRTFLRQFVEAFSAPIYDWCSRNGLEHTGHYNAEDAFVGQIRCHCGGIMAHYRYQHAPGIDHLCRQVDPMLLTVKQVGSAARQLGRPRVLTEIFGVSRHTNTFEDFKWLGDYDLVLGANFFCPHLTWYSAKGRRKRDYPPNWNYQQTYWNELNPLNDYFTRVASGLRAGKASPEVLILHPIESATAGHRFGFLPPRNVGRSEYQYTAKAAHAPLVPADLPREDLGEAHAYDQMLRRILNAALNAGYDADLGDEGYIEDLGSVEGDGFRIGEMTYPVVVVPSSRTWRPKTFALLEQFEQAGGQVIVIGDLPTELDCEDARSQWEAFAARTNVQSVPGGTAQIQEALDRAVPARFRIRDRNGRSVPHVYVQHRRDGDQDLFFVVNSSRDSSRDLVLTAVGQPDAEVAVWDPLHGTRAVLPGQAAGDETRFSFALEPAGSIFLVAGPNAGQEADDLQRSPDLSQGTVTALGPSWDYALSEPNVLVMDRISVSLDGGKTWWGEDLEFRVRKRLAEHFDTSAALRWQPWVAIRKGVFDGKGGEIVLRYHFESEVDQPKQAAIVLEDMDRGALSVNGEAVDTSAAEWHWDRGFGKVDIARLVRRGENVVEFRVDYNFLTEVEAAYVVGDFGVKLTSPQAAAITTLPERLENGSWVENRLPFYSGIVTYTDTFEVEDRMGRTFLRLNRPSGILYKVRVNGSEAGSILWRPFELEITELVQVGQNTVEIVVVSSRQNTWGPLHEKEGDDFLWCGPNAFEQEEIIRPQFSLFDYGLLGGAEIVRI